MQKTSIYWFRQDLRLSDNPALHHAAQLSEAQGGDVMLIYILDDENAGAGRMGAASRVWLHHSLCSLQQQLGGQLRLFRGDAFEILQQLATELQPNIITWNRCYEPWRIARDKRIKIMLEQHNIEAQSFNGSLLFEPWDIVKDDGTPYKVFTPFYRKGCLSYKEEAHKDEAINEISEEEVAQIEMPMIEISNSKASKKSLKSKPQKQGGAKPPRMPLSAPEMTLANIGSPIIKSSSLEISSVEELGLLPKVKWDNGVASHWDISESGAQKRLYQFIKDGLNGYKEGRNFPAKSHVSRLSPYLHFGEISPNQVWHAAQINGENNADLDHFLSELGWREFSYNLLYNNPELPIRNMQSKFDGFAWVENVNHLQAWQSGNTGIPIVDAGMRELYQTGYMHNRMRMIVASVLVKNLRLDWRLGERWFWDCLFDADMANNSASWQWVAGCGADAAPYFRIFNAVTQGTKFDEAGAYTRHYVPELRDLPDKYLFEPWIAPPLILQGAGVQLGKTYPHPIVDLSASRDAALAAFAALKVG